MWIYRSVQWCLRTQAVIRADILLVAASGGFVYIADGKERKLEKPKRKNIKHISPAGVNISTDELTNRKLRRLIQGFDPNRVTADQNLLDGEVF